MSRWYHLLLVGHLVDLHMRTISTPMSILQRAKEYAESNGIDMETMARGCDIRFSREGIAVEENETETLEFRKTKADQLAFGEEVAEEHRGAIPMPSGSACRDEEDMASQFFDRAPGKFLNPLPMGVRIGDQAPGSATSAATGCHRGRTPCRQISVAQLRIGGATALYQATLDIELVKKMGRWTSSSVHRYLVRMEATWQQHPEGWPPPGPSMSIEEI